MSNMSRRNFVKMASAAIAGVSLTGLSGFVSGCGTKAADNKSSATNANKASVQASDKAKVYFTKHIDAEHLQKLYLYNLAKYQKKPHLMYHNYC